MPSLNWIGREAVLIHHNEVLYRLLRVEGGRSVGEADSGNLLVEGDNLEAMKAFYMTIHLNVHFRWMAVSFAPMRS
jgi:hypothetical protein